MSWIKAYKGFNKNLQCQPDVDKPPFWYEVGKEYEESEAVLCSCGFHACEFPLDVFGYYPPADSRYCEVELDAIEEKEGDSKRTGKKIKIGAEIGLDGIIKAGVKFILEKAESCDKGTGYQSAATNTGYQSAATNTGYQSAATNTGYQSAATVSGEESAACALGYEGKAKGAKGCWLVLAEWKYGHRKDVRCFYVDGESVKENVFYKMKDGALVEVD